MVDVVGLRFVTEGQKEALASLNLYERGIRSLSNVQDRSVAEMNRSRRAEMQAFALNQRLKQQALREEERQQTAAARAVTQAAAEKQRATQAEFQAFARAQRLKEQSLREEARAQAEAARAAERAAADKQRALQQEFQAFARTQRLKEQSLREEQAAQQRAAASYTQLRASIDPLFAAQQRLAQAEVVLQQAVTQGLTTRAQAVALMAQYRQQTEMTTNALNANAAAHQFASRGMNGTGMAMQQVGYQVGDFLVQWQSGTNVLVAFGQQATQLVGILPLMGAGFMGLSTGALIALSAGLGIAIPLVTALGAVFLRTRQSAQDAASGVDDLEQSIRSLDSALQDWLRTREAAQLGITADELLGLGSMEDAEAGLRSAREELERLRAVRDALAAAPASPEGAIMGLLSRRNADNGGVQAETDALAALIEAENRLALLRARQGELQFQNFNDRLTQYQEELSLQQTIAQYGEESDQARQVRLDQSIAAEFRRIEALREANEITDAQAVALRILAEEAARAADENERMTDALSGANEVIQFLVSQLGMTRAEAERAASALEALTTLNTGNTVGQINAITRALQVSTAQAIALARVMPGYTSSGVSGPDGAVAQTQALTGQGQGFRAQIAPNAADGGGSGGGAQELATLESIVAAMTQRIERERELIGLFGQARREVEIRQELEDQLRESGQTYTEEQIANAARQIAAQEEVNNAMRRQAEQMESIGKTMETALTSGFMSIVDGTKSASEAFRDMARQIVAELFRVLVVQQLVGQFQQGGGGILGALFGSVNADGNVFARGSVVPFANGGVVNGPMTFPMSQGRTGLMGEAGPEAIMPLRRGRDGKLGVAAQNNGLDVTITMDPSTGALGAFVRNEAGQVVAQAAPRIVDASKSAMLDARQRGGKTRQVFK